MTKREFRRLLRLGLGRAIRYARQQPIDRFYGQILDSCLSDDVYDHQVEDGRDPYLFEIAELHPQRKRIYDEIVAQLPTNARVWSLVVALAKRKHSKAKQALYANFHPTPEFGTYSAEDLVSVDGLRGFRSAVSKLGELILTSSEEVRIGFLIEDARKLLGTDSIEAELNRLGKFGRAVRANLAREDVPSPAKASHFSRFALGV